MDVGHLVLPPLSTISKKSLKQKIDDNATVKRDNVARKESAQDLPVLPPGVSRSKFNSAIEELKKAIGAENVELNDKTT